MVLILGARGAATKGDQVQTGGRCTRQTRARALNGAARRSALLNPAKLRAQPRDGRPPSARKNTTERSAQPFAAGAPATTMQEQTPVGMSLSSTHSVLRAAGRFRSPTASRSRAAADMAHDGVGGVPRFPIQRSASGRRGPRPAIAKTGFHRSRRRCDTLPCDRVQRAPKPRNITSLPRLHRVRAAPCAPSQKAPAKEIGAPKPSLRIRPTCAAGLSRRQPRWDSARRPRTIFKPIRLAKKRTG